MQSAISAVMASLAETSWEGRTPEARRHIYTEAPMLVLKTRTTSALDDWKLLRQRTVANGHYPLLAPSWWGEQMLEADEPEDWGDEDEDEESERMAAEAPARPLPYADVSAEDLDEVVLTSRDDTFYLDGLINLDAEGEHCLNQMRQRFGDAPDREQIRQLHALGKLRNDNELERWLLSWECERFDEAAHPAPNTSHLQWSGLGDQEECLLLLVPTLHGWAAPAFIGWWGFNDREYEKVAQLRQWQQRYGAEVVYADGTTLWLQTERRPADLDEAFELAIQHDAMSSTPRVVSGISLRDHARALLQAERWSLADWP